MSAEPQTSLALHAPEPTIGEILRTMAGQQITKDNVDAFKGMMEIMERQEKRNAEKDFNRAFVALQDEMPVIVAKTEIPNRGKYEKFEDLLETLGPLMRKHGFSVSFSQDINETRIVETCHLRHIGGHSQSNSFAVRTGRADSETQADTKAATTAKRYAFLNALNVVVRQDVGLQEVDDASLEGAFIGADKVQYLREQLAETGSNLESFLKMAAASSLETISVGSYGVLARALEMKKRK